MQVKNTCKYVDIDEMMVYKNLTFEKEDIIFKNKKKVIEYIKSIFNKIFIKLPDDHN